MGLDLIVETDEDGGVLWVWIMEPGARCVRPVRNTPSDRSLLMQATCHGAGHDAVCRWFDERMKNSMPEKPH